MEFRKHKAENVLREWLRWSNAYTLFSSMYIKVFPHTGSLLSFVFDVKQKRKKRKKNGEIQSSKCNFQVDAWDMGAC